MRIATFDHARDVVPAHLELSLEELSGTPHDVRESKDGCLFTAAEYRHGASRGNAGVLRLHLLVLDLDHVLHVVADAVIDRLFAQGLEAWIYSTYSYDENDAQGASLRIVVALSRPVEVSEWSVFWSQALHEIAPEADPACKDPARIYYLPSCPEERAAQAINVYAPGGPLDVEGVLSRAQGSRGRLVTAGDELPVTRRLVAPPIDDEMREWASKRVRDHARLVERAPCPGPIYPTLNHAAYVAGRFVPHVLDRATVFAILHAAHEARNPDAIAKNDLILERGISDGMAVPWRPARPYELTDEGLSQRLLDEHGEELRYIPEWARWLGYDGKRWLSAGDAAPAFLALRDLTASIRDEAEYVGGKRGEALRAAARRLASSSGASSVIRMATPLPKFRTRVDTLDPSPTLLCCENGVVDLTNGTLHEHHRDHLMTGTTRLAYDPDARCPQWLAFMREVCCDDLDLVLYLQRAIGYSITASTSEQCLFFLYGDGANGKSTLLIMLQKILGEYATTCSADLVLVRKHEAHPTGIAALFGRRVAVVPEVDDGRSWDEALIKNLTGADAIAARRMREDFWNFTPKHKLWIAGNYRPSVRGVDSGIWRRMRMIPFEASFAGREDRNLIAKLSAELQGILAWAVQGAVAWQRNGLEPPPRVAAATAAYREEQNFFKAFVEETFEFNQPCEARLSRAQVVQLFEQWRMRNGAPTLGARGIAERMRRFGVGEHASIGVHYWTGVKLRARTFEISRPN